VSSYLKAVLATAPLALSGVAFAHHSYAMFDTEHPIYLIGTVKDFKYTAPHSYIILVVKNEDGTTRAWNLEGGAPTRLAPVGWTGQSLKPGDQIRVKVALLRSGAPGGSWSEFDITFADGRPITNVPVPPAK
jgi:Family of unknown function (DUF6152)